VNHIRLLNPIGLAEAAERLYGMKGCTGGSTDMCTISDTNHCSGPALTYDYCAVDSGPGSCTGNDICGCWQEGHLGTDNNSYCCWFWDQLSPGDECVPNDIC